MSERERPRFSSTHEQAGAAGDDSERRLGEQRMALARTRRAIQRRAARAGGEAGAGGGGSAPSQGAALPHPVRQKMEGSFGADFSGVRVHQGDTAPSVGAMAFAQGNDLHFAPGKYDPGSQSGQELLGHELTHVVQQRAGRVTTPQGKGAPVNADEGLEAEADRGGALAASGQSVEVSGAGAGVQPKLEGSAPMQLAEDPNQLRPKGLLLYHVFWAKDLKSGIRAFKNSNNQWVYVNKHTDTWELCKPEHLAEIEGKPQEDKPGSDRDVAAEESSGGSGGDDHKRAGGDAKDDAGAQALIAKLPPPTADRFYTQVRPSDLVPESLPASARTKLLEAFEANKRQEAALLAAQASSGGGESDAPHAESKKKAPDEAKQKHPVEDGDTPMARAGRGPAGLGASGPAEGVASPSATGVDEALTAEQERGQIMFAALASEGFPFTEAMGPTAPTPTTVYKANIGGMELEMKLGEIFQLSAKSGASPDEQDKAAYQLSLRLGREDKSQHAGVELSAETPGFSGSVGLGNVGENKKKNGIEASALSVSGSRKGEDGKATSSMSHSLGNLGISKEDDKASVSFSALKGNVKTDEDEADYTVGSGGAEAKKKETVEASASTKGPSAKVTGSFSATLKQALFSGSWRHTDPESGVKTHSTLEVGGRSAGVEGEVGTQSSLRATQSSTVAGGSVEVSKRVDVSDTHAIDAAAKVKASLGQSRSLGVSADASGGPRFDNKADGKNRMSADASVSADLVRKGGSDGKDTVLASGGASAKGGPSATVTRDGLSAISDKVASLKASFTEALKNVKFVAEDPAGNAIEIDHGGGSSSSEDRPSTPTPASEPAPSGGGSTTTSTKSDDEPAPDKSMSAVEYCILMGGD